MGGYMDHVRPAASLDPAAPHRRLSAAPDNPWPLTPLIAP
jgi:hypothetical protein